MAILSIEQASAIDICNLRNGTSARSTTPTEELTGVPSPDQCITYGVEVRADATPIGTILGINEVPIEELYKYCGWHEGLTGCTLMYQNQSNIIFHSGDPDVIAHEKCHAYYFVEEHTAAYNDARGL